MKLSSKAKNIYNQINGKTTQLGNLRKIAAGIKKDHEFAVGLWATQEFSARLLAILIMDKKSCQKK